MLVFRRSHFTFLVAALFCFVVFSGAVVAQSGQLSPEVKNQLDKLSEVIAGSDIQVPRVLEQLGFPPSSTSENWRQWKRWPDVRMLETAYVSAEAGKTGSGDALLRKVARLVATQNEAIRHEPALSSIFSEPIGTPIKETVEPMIFGVPNAEQLKTRVPENIRTIIKTVTRYTERTSRVWLFGRCCNLSEDETYEVLRTYPDEHSAFEAAVALKAPPPTPDQKVEKLIATIHTDNPAIALEPELQGVLRSSETVMHEKDLTVAANQVAGDVQNLLLPMLGNNPSSGTGMLLPSSPPGSPGGGPAGRMLGENYNIFKSTRYPGGGPGWSHSRMITRAIGFGGVIFGNTVSPPAKSSDPVQVYWLTSPDAPSATAKNVVESWGRLVFAFKDGTIARSRLIRADTTLAAKALALDHAQASAGGYGLVGFLRSFDAKKLTDEDKIVSFASGFSYVVHPDVAATRVGRSMILLDTLPMIPEILRKQVSDSGAVPAINKQLESILDGHLGQYKYTDVKLEILRTDDGLLSVQRSSADGTWDANTRTQAFITLLAFDGDTPRQESSVPTYPLIPVLTAVSDPFARANEFAEVFALLRWANGRGAKWSGTAPPPSNLKPVSAVVVEQNGAFTFGNSEGAFNQALVTEVQDRALKIAGSNNNSALTAKTEDLRARFTKVVAMRTALDIAGSASEIAAAAFSTDNDLAKQYPEAAKNALNASSFRNDDKTFLSKLQSIDWIDAHTDLMEKAVPGTKARGELATRLENEQKSLSDTLGDSEVLFSELTNKKFDGTRDKLISDVLTAKDVKHMFEAQKKLSDAEEKMLPGFSRWFALESALARALTE
jgi:hypothetical protein